MKARAVVRDVGARHGHSVRRRRPRREGHSARARHDARQSARRKSGAEGDAAEGRARQGAARRRAASRRHDPSRVRSRRRRRHRPETVDGVRPALQEPEGRNHHAVGDEGNRACRPPEDGFPRAEHAHAHPRCARRNQAHRRRRHRHRRHSAGRRQDVSSCSAMVRRTASSSSKAPACATCCARPSRSVSTTSSR